MISGVKFGIKDVILNTFFLAWFCKMPGVGHFWFVTMIVFCYLSFILLSKYQILRNLYSCGGYLIALIFICCTIEYGMDRMKLPGLMIGVLLITGFVFVNASGILTVAEKNKLVITTMSLTFTSLTIALLYMGWYELHRTTSYILMNVCGLLWFMALLGFGMNIGCTKVIKTLSVYSYEIYLVHHSFCTGPWSVYHITKDPFWALVLIIIATTLIAVPLHILGNKTYTIINRNKYDQCTN